MQVRIVFKSEIYLDGDSMEEVVQKWESMELFSDEANSAEVSEQGIVCVEELPDYKDVTDEFCKY